MAKSGKALPGAKDELQEYLDLLLSAHVKLAVDGTILKVGKSFAELAGSDGKKLAGMKITDDACLELSSSDRSALADGLKAAAIGDSVCLQLSVAGSVFDVHLTPGPMVRKKPAFISMEMAERDGPVSAVDMARQKRAEEDILRKNEDLCSVIEELTAAEEELKHNYDLLARQDKELRDQYDELILSRNALAYTEEKYRNVIEHSPMGMHFYDLTPDDALVFTGANPAADAILGVPNEQFVGMTVEDAFPGLADTEVPARYRQIASEGGTWETDQVNYHQEKIYGAFVVSAFRTKPGSMVAVFFDITERKQAELELQLKNRELGTAYEELTAVEEELRINYDELRIRELELRESEERWRRLVEINYACVLIHIEGKIVYANDASLHLLRVPALADLIGKPVLDLVHVDSKNVVIKRIDMVTREGLRAERIEEKFVRPDGSVIDVEVVATPAMYEGKPAVMTVSWDITDRKRMEEALRRSEQQLHDIINHLPDATVAVDKDGMIIAWNLAIEQLTGYKTIDMMGKGNYEYALPFYGSRRPILIDFINQPDVEIEKAFYKNIDREGEALMAETSMPRLNGRNVVIWAKASPLFNDRGERIGAIETIRDVTERKKTEEALQLTQFSVDHAADAVYWITEDGSFAYVNDAACDLLGYTREELLALRLYDIDPRLTQERWKERWKKIKTNPSRNIEAKQRRKDGTLVPVEITSRYFVVGGKGYDFAIARDVTELKRSEQLMKLIEFSIDRAADMIVWVGEDASILYVNDSYCKAMGYSREEMLQKSVFDVNPGFTRENWGRHWQEMRELGSGTFMSSLKRKGGVVFPVEISANYFIYQGQEMHCTFIKDITERKRDQEALQLTQFSIDHAADAVYWIKEDGSFAYVNDAACEMLGYSRGELLQLRLYDIDPRLTQERWKERWKKIKTNPSMILEARQRRKDGLIIPVEVTSRYFAVGGHEYDFAMVRDVTERKRLFDALQESEEKFRVLAETSPTAICLYQGEKFFYVNRSMERMSGYSADELVHMKFWEWIYPEDRQTVMDRGLKRQKGEDVPGEYEFRFISKTGELRWVVISAGRIEYKGRPAGIATFMDITERRKAEDQIRASLKEKEVLLKEIHHRVKNNLQIVSSMLNLQIPSMKDPDDVEVFRESQNRIKSMALIHEKLYRSDDISRVDFGDYMQSLLSSLYKFYTINPERIGLEQEIDKVYLDIDNAITCGMIVNEIISNILKHAFPGDRCGKIMLKLKQEPDGLIHLEISDDGVGLPEGFDITRTSTLGLQLITSLVDQIEASMDIIKGHGLTYKISFRPVTR